MDCGVPFCHWACPLGNKQPEFQDALYKGKWREAYEVLAATNDFPEFTGRICPALCEKSCVLKLSCDEPVTIRENEAAIAEAAFREGYIVPIQPQRNGKRVAIIGAGPAGLSAACRLNAKGYEVTLFDSKPMPGGLLRYGIPNFKLDKAVIDRRMGVLEAEGIKFEMGVTVDVQKLPAGFDAYCICTGTPQARDLNIPGRELTVTVMGDKALCVTELCPHSGFYDYEAKYTDGKTTHLCPAPVDETVAQRCLDHALTAHRVLGCRGVSRADFRYDEENDRLVILEVNTQPGMTPLSLAPEQASHMGISFPDLVAWMVENASCDG